MNCWKSVNLDKQYGLKWINLISIFTALLSFIILNVPFSIFHQVNQVNDSGIILFLLAIILLPTLHSFMHILPLFLFKRRINLIILRKKALPVFTFYTDTHISKNAFIISALAPTLIITIPGLIATLVFPNIYIYFLLITSLNIGISFLDYLTIFHLIKAPKNAFIENGNEGFDILLKAN
ncbi:DUF3267 domain-containing protein [Paucisalibacillus globulus]|uniref:DUF3267 domain-containing protein n=1 Tax=Paucisalibacillus globulus TaxID=351095 RepID=UPI000405847C|nr:DUF3267 domain-containing protein [Paucisalibacillus globulus]